MNLIFFLLGTSVRNLHAFQVLQSVFPKSNTTFLSVTILDSISSIFKADHNNYFIVDSVLPQMAEKLIHKSLEVQQKYLEIVEFVVFQLQFTPYKELIAISRILKNDLAEDIEHKRKNSVLPDNGGEEDEGVFYREIETELRLKLICVKMLLNVAKHNNLFKDAFREVGIFEVLLTCLHRFASDVQSAEQKEG